MPNENDTAAAPDPRDVRIKDLELQLKSARSDNDDLRAEINAMSEDRDEVLNGYETEIKSLKDQLARKPAATGLPEGDVVVLDGKQYPVVKTVRANTTFDEVKKGNVDEGVTLVVIERPH